MQVIFYMSLNFAKIQYFDEQAAVSTLFNIAAPFCLLIEQVHG